MGLPRAEPSEKKGWLDLSDLRCQEARNVNNSGKVSFSSVTGPNSAFTRKETVTIPKVKERRCGSLFLY